MVVSSAAVGAAVKTEGQSGPIAWRATDLGRSRGASAGQAVIPTSSRRVKNVSDRTIGVHEDGPGTVYQAGGGDPWPREPRRAVGAAAGRRTAVSHSTRTPAAPLRAAARTAGGAQPLWQIVFTAWTTRIAPSRSRFSKSGCPRARRQFTCRSRPRPAGPLAGSSAERSVIPAPTPDQPATQVNRPRDVLEPRRRGDRPAARGRVEFRSDSSRGKARIVWTVDREETIDGVPTYVIRTGTWEIFYRKADIAALRETVEGVPPHASPARLRYVWPLGAARPGSSRSTKSGPRSRARPSAWTSSRSRRRRRSPFRRHVPHAQDRLPQQGTRRPSLQEWYARAEQPFLLRERSARACASVS